MARTRAINGGAAAALLIIAVSLYAWGYTALSVRTRLSVGSIGASSLQKHEGRVFRSKWQVLFFAPALAVESLWAWEKIYPAWREP